MPLVLACINRVRNRAATDFRTRMKSAPTIVAVNTSQI